MHMVRAMRTVRCGSSLYKQDQSVYKSKHVVRCDAVHVFRCDWVLTLGKTVYKFVYIMLDLSVDEMIYYTLLRGREMNKASRVRF